ncbi:MAG: OmpA family protein [Pseudomonadota bacterium]|nr:OmpA family protein [Pseudomonadota bacterium]
MFRLTVMALIAILSVAPSAHAQLLIEGERGGATINSDALAPLGIIKLHPPTVAPDASNMFIQVPDTKPAATITRAAPPAPAVKPASTKATVPAVKTVKLQPVLPNVMLNPPEGVDKKPALPSARNGPALTLPFVTGDTHLGSDVAAKLAELATTLAERKNVRLQLRSFAAPDPVPGKDRSLALSRALAVRNVLIDSGIEARRIDVRALGARGDVPRDYLEIHLTGG